MERYTSVDDYIDARDNDHKEGLKKLRSLLLSTELVETVKWGAPTYTINGKNVLGMGSFKSYLGLWFFQGVFLKDPAKKLINAQEGVTQGLRQWRFDSFEDLDEKLILEYVLEAIQNQKDGKMINPNKSKPLIIPPELEAEFEKSGELKSSFESLNLTKKREFTEYIDSAKREATKMSRLDKIIPMIQQGIGLNDKYRK